MVLVALVGTFSIVGLLVGLLVLRADPTRSDNRVFAAMCFVDAFAEAARAAHLLDGGTLGSSAMMGTCLYSSTVLAWVTAEFAYTFPFDQAPPRPLRAAGLTAMGVTLALALWPPTYRLVADYASVVYFLPLFGLVLYFFARNLRRIPPGQARAGVLLAGIAVTFRWLSSLFAFIVARRISPELFDGALVFDAVVAIFVCYALLGHAILKHHLFRVAGVVADVVLYGGLTLSTLGVLYLGIDLVLSRPLGPMHLRATLVAVALVPWLVYALGRKVLPRLAAAVVAPIDPRRAEMRAVLEDLVHQTAGQVDWRALLAATLEAAGAATGGRVTFLMDPEFRLSSATCAFGGAPEEIPSLEPALAGHLAGLPGPLHRPLAVGLAADVEAALERTPGDLFVPVRHEGRLFGAIVLSGGTLDRDVVLTAGAMAEHLALKLQYYALFSERLRLEGELEEAKRLAALGAFAAAIAHDLRTPLTSVQMNVQILRGKVKLPPDDMEYFDIALEELRRLNTHITELLDYAKPVRVAAAPVDLRELADDAARGIEPVLGGRRLAVVREYEDVPAALVDGPRIRQVLVNLLENAAQASEPGARIHLRTRRGDGHVALEVADHGRGISAEHLSKIFEPFFTTRPDGTGLGLAIAQKLVRAHGGEIRVTSALGQGSTFTIRLPAAP